MTAGDPPIALTPYFTVDGADRFLDFVVEVLDGQVVRRGLTDDGLVQHARCRIGDSLIMVNDAGVGYTPSRQQMYLYVPDVDATYDRALAHGATSLMAPELRPYGDRIAGVVDPFGNIWWVACPA